MGKTPEIPDNVIQFRPRRAVSKVTRIDAGRKPQALDSSVSAQRRRWEAARQMYRDRSPSSGNLADIIPFKPRDEFSSWDEKIIPPGEAERIDEDLDAQPDLIQRLARSVMRRLNGIPNQSQEGSLGEGEGGKIIQFDNRKKT